MTKPVNDLARRIARLERNYRRLATQPQLAHSSFEGGAILEYEVASDNVVQAIGMQYDGTHTAAQFNGPTPPAPSAPTLAPAAGGLIVTWDGLFVDDADGNTQVAPMDFARVEIHVSDTPDFDTSFSTTLMTTFDTARGGSKSINVTSVGTKYVKLVTRSQSGKRSVDSAQASVDVDWELALPPTTAPTASVVGGIGGLHVSWPVTVNPSGYDVEVHLSTSAGFTPSGTTLAATTRGTYVFLDSMPDGTDLAPLTTYYVKLVATAGGGTVISPEVSATLRQVDTPDISVGAAWVGTMTVDRLIGGVMQADTVVGGQGGVYAQGANGERVGLWATGFRVEGSAATNYKTYVDFPTSGAPNIISGILKATTLEVEGDATTGKAVSLRGYSELAAGGELRMQAGLGAPITKPLLTAAYLQTAVNWNGQPAPTNLANIRGGWYDNTASLYYFVAGNRVYWMNGSAVVQGSADLSGLFPANTGNLQGITNVGGNFYVLHIITVAGTPYGAVCQIAAGWGSITKSFMPHIMTVSRLAYSAIGTDGTNIFVATRESSTDDVIFTAYSPSVSNGSNGFAYMVGGERTYAQNATDWSNNGVLTGMVASTSDLGTDRVILSQATRILVLNKTSGARVTADEFPPASDGPILLAGTNVAFSSIGSDGTWYQHAPLMTGGTHLHVANTRWDAAGPYESAPSPVASQEIVKRAYVKATVAYSGAPSTKVYAVIGTSTPPAASALWYYYTQSSPNDTTYLGINVPTSGSHPNGAIPFPTSSPAQIISTDGLTYWKADGIAKFKKLQAFSDIDITAGAGNEPPLRVGDANARHIRFDGNQIQSMENDNTATSSLNINVEIDSAGNSAPIVLGPLGSKIKRMRVGNTAVTANASGVATISHGLGVVPTNIIVSKRTVGIDGSVQSGNYTSTGFDVTLRKTDGTLFANGQTTTVEWMAFEIG